MTNTSLQVNQVAEVAAAHAEGLAHLALVALAPAAAHEHQLPPGQKPAHRVRQAAQGSIGTQG